MGLDMYAYAVNKNNLPSEVKDNLAYVGRLDKSLEGKLVNIHYWRKHHDFHGLMFLLANNRVPSLQPNDFNCMQVRLSEMDLDAIEAVVRENKLPETHGFFFGNYPPDDESRLDDLTFINKARELIQLDNAIFYDSWW